ncbi:MAG TPA: hypothetical protein VI172_13955, partial [Candidatus Dormibacteraeota bacterium]
MAIVRRRRTLAPEPSREEGDGYRGGDAFLLASSSRDAKEVTLGRTYVFRSLAIAVGALSLAAACGGGTGTQSEQLATDQTLSFPMVDDIGDIDPALEQAAVDVNLFRNVFSGLYKFDDQLNEVPDIAEGMPNLS